jgi:hypothetical protein
MGKVAGLVMGLIAKNNTRLRSMAEAKVSSQNSNQKE